MIELDNFLQEREGMLLLSRATGRDGKFYWYINGKSRRAYKGG